jgi:hypothetical protein
MSHQKFVRLLVAAAVAVTLAACADQSPVAPDQVSLAQGGADAKPSTGVPGIYTLSFLAWVWDPVAEEGAYQEVSSLPVYTPGGPNPTLQLKAQVTDVAGNPATAGTVTFEYCSYGPPYDDIANADEAPKEDCEPGGRATWIALRRGTRVNDGTCVHLGNPSGCTYFSVVRIPRAVGFRFRYDQKGSKIPSGTSEARNFVWTAQLP